MNVRNVGMRMSRRDQAVKILEVFAFSVAVGVMAGFALNGLIKLAEKFF